MREIIKKKKAAITCAAVILGLLGIFIAMLLLTVFDAENGILIAIGILLIYVFAILAVVVGIILALRQRLKEIESGEEEAAKKY